jgi:microcystin-dependent protein
MPFIIPNATDTTPGGKYAFLDQAEPDSIDFEILGNDQNGVVGVNDCVVDVVPSGGTTAIGVSSGTVAIKGVTYSVLSNPFLTVPGTPGTGRARFDLVVARLIGSQISLTILVGAESSTNPALPVSKSRRNSLTGLTANQYYDPETDVALAAIYRRSDLGSILSSHIVDKRKVLQTAIAFRGTAIPSPTLGSTGDLYLRTSAVSNGESGLYVKRSSNTWAQLASSPIDPGIPIGTLITWIAPTDPNPDVWVECSGATVGRAGAYSSLFSVVGTTYGPGDGSTSFTLPDLRGMFLAGLPAAGASLGIPAGNAGNNITLSADQVPGHTHGYNHGHTGSSAESGSHFHTSDSGSHVHGMNHSHSASITGSGEHTHSANYLQNANNTGPNHYLRPMNYPTDGLIAAIPQSGGHSHTVSVSGFTGFTSTPSSGNNSTTDSGRHAHNVTINTSTGLVSDPNRTTPPNSVNIQPRTMYVRYFIRYA